MAVVVDLPKCPPLTVRAAYLWTSEGFTPRNSAILTRLVRVLEKAAFGLAAADFNMTARAVEASGMPRQAGAIVMTAALPTCMVAKGSSAPDFLR